jgi:hypothetical protein
MPYFDHLYGETMMDLPTNWNWNQAKAAGKHLASYAAGGVTVAVAWGLLSSAQGTELTTDIGHVTSGLTELGKGLAGIAGILTPIYTMWRSAHNASPPMQALSLEQAVPGTTIVTSQAVAAATPSANVVSNTDVKVVSK